MKTKEIENLYLNVGALNISNQHYINIFTNYYLIGKSQVKMAYWLMMKIARQRTELGSVEK